MTSVAPHEFDLDPEQPSYAPASGYCRCGWLRNARVHQVSDTSQFDLTGYHEGQPGEVSLRASIIAMSELLANPFTDGAIVNLIGYRTPMLARTSRRPWLAAGALKTYYDAAALRTLTRMHQDIE